MAGEWIKMRTNLWSDPRVSQMCDLTDKSKATIIGALYWLWASADEHTQTGHMPGLSTKGIDRDTTIKGFGAALVTIGWIEDTPGGVTLLRFSEHNGASAKTRATTAKRVANHAAKSKSSETPNAELTQNSEITNGPSVSLPLAREEKSIQELNTPIPPEGGDTQPSRLRRKTAAIALQTFLDACKAEGRKPIPEGAPVFAYAAQAGIPNDFLRLQWLEFKDRYADGSKRYKDWPAVFSKSVRGNWFKLWFADGDGYKLSTIGVQAQHTHEGKK